MSSRAIYAIRSIFHVLLDPTLIPNNSPVEFSQIIADFYSQNSDDTVNHIIYYTDTCKFRIITTSTTQNDFLIIWAVCLSSCNSNLLPTFTILIETEDGSEFTSFPNSGSRTTDTLYGNCLLHLPTPSADLGRVVYYLSLVNRSGAECFYSTKAIRSAGILITSIDS